jgi:hypothetical protein
MMRTNNITIEFITDLSGYRWRIEEMPNRMFITKHPRSDGYVELMIKSRREARLLIPCLKTNEVIPTLQAADITFDDNDWSIKIKSK